MTNQEILESKEQYNKWLLELTDSERTLILDMMDEAREFGYDKGYEDGRR